MCVGKRRRGGGREGLRLRVCLINVINFSKYVKWAVLWDFFNLCRPCLTFVVADGCYIYVYTVMSHDTHTRIYIHIYIHIYIYVNIYTYMNVPDGRYVYVYTVMRHDTHTRIYIYIYTYIHICIYIYI